MTVPAARPGPLFAAALAATALLWLPLAVIPILDGVLFVASWREAARDLGLLWLLSPVPAAVLALAGWLTSAIAGVAGAGVRARALAGWLVTLSPLVWISAWLGGRMLWTWIKTVTGLDIATTQGLRTAAVLSLLAAFSLLLVRMRLAPALTRLASGMLALRWPTIVVLVAALAAVVQQPPTLLWGDAPPRPSSGTLPPRGPDIFVISLDALAAADADACNPQSPHMPRLAALAQRGSCFSRFYTASNFTTPTTSTMESGLLPWSHFATQPDAKMVPSARGHTLAATLRERGWRTHMVTDNLLASPRHRGTFAAYDSTGFVHTTLYGNWLREMVTVFPDTALPRLAATALSILGSFDMALHSTQSPYVSERTYEAMLSLLAREGRAAPQFVWAHTLPPHSPYLPPAATRHRLLPAGELELWSDMLPDNVEYPEAQQVLVDKHRQRYRESIMAADAALGAFLDELDRQERLDGALIVVTSDHGESFEKGFIGHTSPLLHDVLIRVPLVVKLPGQRNGRIVDQPVSQADLAPTLLDLAGAAPLPRAEGRSLRPLLEGGTLASAPVFTMAMERQSRFKPIAGDRFAVIDGPHKLVRHGTRGRSELYDLVTDPNEANDLVATQPAIVTRLQSLLDERLAAAESARRAALQR